MQLSSKQLHELLNIINSNQALVVGQEFGLSFLSSNDLDLLNQVGVDIDDIYDLSTDTTFTSFHFGLLSDSLDQLGVIEQITYQDLVDYIKRGDYIPLNATEKATIDSIKSQGFTSLKTSGSKIFQDINNIVVENTNKGQREFLTKESQKGIERKQTVRQIANEIARKTGDWSRDFDRIIQYTSQTAYEQGKAATIVRQNGQDALVYKTVFEQACKHCIRLFLTQGIGSQPRIFKLSELIANGSNIGRKVADWKPTVDSVHPYCFDDKTEVLTDQGFKFFKDLNKSETFLSVNLQTGVGEYKKAVKWINQRYEGDMYKFTNKNFDLVTTPNHHHVINTYGNKKYRLVETTKLPNTSSFLTHIPQWNGKELQYLIFDDKKYEADNFIKFLGFFISEGAVVKYQSKKSNHLRTTLHISQSEEKYLDKIYNLCVKVFKKSVVKCKDYVQILMTKQHKELVDFLSLGKSNQKYIPQYVKDSCSRQINLFLTTFCKGDGSLYKGRQWDGYQCNDYRLFYTSSKRLADDLGELILKIGKKPSYKIKPAVEIYDPKRGKSYMQNNDIIVISELSNKHAYLPSMKKEIFHYNGRIYDVELEANHTLIVRRNGKITVSGNCRCNMHHLDDGMEWNQESKRFKRKQDYQSKLKKPRQKVRAVIGGKQVMI